VQSTAILYLNRQATQDLAIAQQARVGIITELNVLGRQQTAMATQLTIAEEAQAAATAELAAAQRVATFSLTGFIAGLTLAGVAMAALSAATSIFIGLQLATYLNEFVAVQNAGASAANYLIKTMETLNYVTEKAILLSKLDIDGARQLRIEHEAFIASENETTASIIAANNATEKGSALTGEMAAALESLKTPQEVYNQKIKDATEASKTLDSEALKLDSTSKKMLITEEQRLAVGVKALEIWRQANAEEQNAKLSAAGKEAAKLQDQYDKLTLSPKDYNN
jgi:CRISPR/Cas system CMR-associated protein Cmr5 small subunit